jgi:hypothetical protein
MIFLCRFSDDRVLIVPLTFFSLTALLITILTIELISVQIPVGGIRYFSVLAIIPGFHLLLEFISGEPLNRPFAQYILLALQAIILSFAMYTVGIAIYILLPITVGLLHSLIFGVARNALREAAFVASLGLITYTSMNMNAPASYKESALQEVVWHRLFIGLGAHPDWPFGDLKNVYSCAPENPRGSRSEHCRSKRSLCAVSYLKQHQPDAFATKLLPGLYGPEYEAALRAAFF